MAKSHLLQWLLLLLPTLCSPGAGESSPTPAPHRGISTTLTEPALCPE